MFSLFGGGGKTPAQAAQDCVAIFARNLKSIPEDVAAWANIIDEKLGKAVVDELVMLVYIGQRLAIQQSRHDRSKLQELGDAFDSATSRIIPTEWDDLLDKRGIQYFEMLKAHAGDAEGFRQILTFKFRQFCLGGGEESDPIILGGLSFIPLDRLAMSYWMTGHFETREMLNGIKLK